MRKTLAAVCLSAIALLGFSTQADAYQDYPAQQSWAGTAPSTCDMTSNLGARICYNANNGYFYIYSAANTVAISFPSNSGVTYGSGYNYSGYFGAWADPVGSANTIYAKDANSAADVAILRAGQYDTYKSIYVYGGNFDHLLWWSNQPNIELVVVKLAHRDLQCWPYSEDIGSDYALNGMNYYMHTSGAFTQTLAVQCFNALVDGRYPVLDPCFVDSIEFNGTIYTDDLAPNPPHPTNCTYESMFNPPARVPIRVAAWPIYQYNWV